MDGNAFFTTKSLFDDAINLVDVLFDSGLNKGILKSSNKIFSRFADPGEIEFEVPGIKKTDIKLTIEKVGTQLAIRVEANKKDKKYYGLHIVRAEEVDIKGITSRYENGLLTVKIPKINLEDKSKREVTIE